MWVLLFQQTAQKVTSYGLHASGGIADACMRCFRLDGKWNHGTCVAGSFSGLHPGTTEKALPVLELKEPNTILCDVLNSP